MHFLLWSLVFMIAALVHGALARAPVEKRVELVLVYLLAGYYGAINAAIAVFFMLVPDHAAERLGAPSGNIFQQFAGVAYLAMAVSSIACVRLRGVYLAGPIICWCVFFYGATVIHIADFHARGASPHGYVTIVLAHAVVPTALVGLGLWLWRRTVRWADH